MYYFKLSFITLVLWLFLMPLLNPANGSVLKAIITLLLYTSFINAVLFLYTNFHVFMLKFGRLAIALIFLLLSWNIIVIVRGVFSENVEIYTVLGNPYTSLSLLIPFVFAFGLKENIIKILRKYLYFLLDVGIYFMPIIIINFFFWENKTLNIVFLYFFFGTILLQPTFIFENKKNKFKIILSVLLMTFFVAIESRAAFLRSVLLIFIPVLSFYLYRLFKLKSIFKLSILILLVPIFFLYQGILSEQSIFQKLSGDSEMSTDTRTFLYTEVIGDLVKTKSLLMGKGSSAHYYSEYFASTGGDSSSRLTVEVGFLTMLLKGGIIAVFLNFLIFIYAIYLAFVKSNNYYSIALGYFLIVHFFLLFIENLIAYNMYNFLVWFVVGLLLNKNFRSLNNKQINMLIDEKQQNLNRNTLIQSRSIHRRCNTVRTQSRI